MALVTATCIVAAACLLSLLDLALGIAEIVMGAKYLSDCPAQRMIPVYLVVAGCVGVVLSMTNCIRVKTRRDLREREGPQHAEPGNRDTCLLSLLSIFAFVWLICGMVWIFGVSPTFSASASDSRYCYKPLYQFAMAAALLRLVVVALYFLGIFCACCICCGSIIGMGMLGRQEI